MLQKLREQTNSLVFKVIVGALIVTMAVFGFGAFNLFVTGEPEVASVNGEGITESELAAATERERRRLAAQMGEDFDPSLIDPVRLQASVLEQLIARRVLRDIADDLGMDVSRERVDELLVSNPTFQIDGRFQASVYRQAVQAMGYTPQGFLDETRELMTLQQLQNGVAGSALLTKRELNLHASLLGQRRDVAYLPFETDRFRERVEVSDDEVRLRYDENQQAYMTEEAVDVAYVMLTADALLDDPAIQVTEADLRSAYDSQRESAPPDEERRSRHILLEVGEKRSAEQAVAELEEIKARIEAGESFAEIAKTVSEDPGSAAQGGELGFAGRGVFDAAFEEALFALEQPGDVSEPVRTEFGVHLIQLEEVRRNEFPSFEAKRDELERQLRREKAQELYQERLRELDNLAFENPTSLDPVKDALKLEVQHATGVTRSAGPPPLDDPQVRGRLFVPEVLQNGFNSAAVEVGDGRAIVMRVTEHHPPEPIPFEEVADDIRGEIEMERARVLAQEAFEAARAELEAGTSAAAVASEHGGNWQRFELVRRDAAQVPRAVLQAAFALARPPEGGKAVGRAELPTGPALVTVTRVQDGDVAALTEGELNGMKAFLGDRAARLEFGALYETARSGASVRRADRS
ncbi:MAG TPA: SurA N-terminal domain-containing protein [Pseudomonadales bacterium]